MWTSPQLCPEETCPSSWPLLLPADRNVDEVRSLLGTAPPLQRSSVLVLEASYSHMVMGQKKETLALPRLLASWTFVIASGFMS
jgi:hypothetical protein